MLKIVTVKSRVLDRTSKFVLKSGQIEIGDFVVFETESEVGFGKIVLIELVPKINQSSDIVEATFRVACNSDFEKIKRLVKSEKQALQIIKEEVNKHFKYLKIMEIEYSFNRKKLYIYFSSDERVDFKILLKFLFKKLKVWIEFKQLNVRDVAKFYGGIGVCGRNICCNSFLKTIKKINSSSIVNQKMYLGGTKYCGLCGRLMCCLNYEEEMYSDALKKMPKVGDIVKTSNGSAIVTALNSILQMVQVSLSSNSDTTFWVKNSDLEVI